MNSVTKDDVHDRDMSIDTMPIIITDHDLQSQTNLISHQEHLNIVRNFQEQEHSSNGSSTSGRPMSGHNTPGSSSNISGHATPVLVNSGERAISVSENLSGHTTPVPTNLSGHTTPVNICVSGHTTPASIILNDHITPPMQSMSGHSTPISHIMEDSTFEVDKHSRESSLSKDDLRSGVLMSAYSSDTESMDRLRPIVLMPNMSSSSVVPSSSLLPSIVINEVEMSSDSSDQWPMKEEHPGHEFIRVIQPSPNDRWRTPPRSSGCIMPTSSSSDGGGVIIRDVTLAVDPNTVKQEDREVTELKNVFIPCSTSTVPENQSYSSPPLLTTIHSQGVNHNVSPLQEQVKSEPSLPTSPINISVQLPTVSNQHDGLGYRVLVCGENGTTQELDQVASHIVEPLPSSHEIESLEGTTTLHGSGANEGVTYTTLETASGTAPLSTIQYSDSYFYYKNDIYPKEEVRRPYDYPPPPTYLAGPSQTHSHSNPYLQKLDPATSTPVWGISGHSEYSQDYMDRAVPFHSYMSTAPPPIAWSHTYEPPAEQSIAYTYRIESSDPEIMEKKECVQCGSLTASSFQRELGGSVVCTDCTPYYKNGTVNRPHVRAQRRGASPVGPYATATVAQQGQRRAGMTCSNCHTTNTTLWRRNNAGEPVCNACGLYFKLHGVARPLTMKKEGPIQTRKRKPKSSSTGHGSSIPNSMNIPSISMHQGLKAHQASPYVITSFPDAIPLESYGPDPTLGLHDLSSNSQTSHLSHNSHILSISPHQMATHPHIMTSNNGTNNLLEYSPIPVSTSAQAIVTSSSHHLPSIMSSSHPQNIAHHQVIKQLPLLEPLEDVLIKYEPVSTS